MRSPRKWWRETEVEVDVEALKTAGVVVLGAVGFVGLLIGVAVLQDALDEASVRLRVEENRKDTRVRWTDAARWEK